MRVELLLRNSVHNIFGNIVAIGCGIVAKLLHSLDGRLGACVRMPNEVTLVRLVVPELLVLSRWNLSGHGSYSRQLELERLGAQVDGVSRVGRQIYYLAALVIDSHLPLLYNNRSVFTHSLAAAVKLLCSVKI